MSNNNSFYVGTYTTEDSKGIYRYSINGLGVLKKEGLVAQTDNPSFLVKSMDEKFLMVVNENGGVEDGTVESYAIVNDTLTFIDRKSSGGKFPCFVTINKSGHVLTANYGDGTIGLLQLKANGKLSDLLDVEQHTGTGSHPRQNGPHAHSVWFDINERNIISLDLGTNELWFSKIDAENNKLVATNPGRLAMSDGCGPRHLTVHPNAKWLYVINELSSTVTLIKRTDSETYLIGASISTLPKNYNEPNTGADIHISSDGKFVYASNRGHDSIAIYQVDSVNGTLAIVGHESTRGVGPRNFTMTPDENFLLVANQKTNTLCVFKRNQEDGTLQYVDQIGAPTPICILF